jgi:hypothetical protein
LVREAAVIMEQGRGPSSSVGQTCLLKAAGSVAAYGSLSSIMVVTILSKVTKKELRRQDFILLLRTIYMV